MRHRFSDNTENTRPNTHKETHGSKGTNFFQRARLDITMEASIIRARYLSVRSNTHQCENTSRSLFVTFTTGIPNHWYFSVLRITPHNLVAYETP